LPCPAFRPCELVAISSDRHTSLVLAFFSRDAQQRPKTQRVGSHAVSGDGLTWRSTLREGLAFHDGDGHGGVTAPLGRATRTGGSF
jgi:peptide/nickel transport system substrate-binding protein